MWLEGWTEEDFAIGPSGYCLSRFSALIGEKKRHYQHEDTNPAQIEITALSAWEHKKGTISISTQNFSSFSDVGKQRALSA